MTRLAVAVVGTVLVGLILLVGTEARAHAGHANPAMWEVCQDASLGEACRFVGPHGNLHIGTCRNLGGHQACVRNRPVQPASEPAVDGEPKPTAPTAAPPSSPSSASSPAAAGWSGSFAILLAFVGMIALAARARNRRLNGVVGSGA